MVSIFTDLFFRNKPPSMRKLNTVRRLLIKLFRYNERTELEIKLAHIHRMINIADTCQRLKVYINIS